MLERENTFAIKMRLDLTVLAVKSYLWSVMKEGEKGPWTWRK